MEQSTLEHVKLRVPCQEGYILGDLLRKFAIRGAPSWQIIGYVINSVAPSFGVSEGVLVSHLNLLQGVLEVKGDVPAGLPQLREFTWNGTSYACTDFEIKGLIHGFGDTITVALAHCTGTRSAKQNYEYFLSTFGNVADGIYAVPSRHVNVTKFKYDVTPIDDESEWLSISADDGVIRSAYSRAVKSLSRLNL